MKFTDRLFTENEELWSTYLEHPFILGMQDGSLDIEAFRYYMLQDYLYLKEYAKVFAIGISKTSNVQDVLQLSESMSAIAWEVDSVHKKYMERIGITEEMVENVEPSMSNLGYTSYMIARAHESDVVNACMAVLSCSWSYGYIGKEIMKRTPNLVDDNIYGEWIKVYGSDEYDDANQKLMDMVDRLCDGLNEDRLSELSEIFKNCSLFEMRFWDMAYTKGASDVLEARYNA